MSLHPQSNPGEWVDKQVFLPEGHKFGQSKTPHLDSALTFMKGQKGTLGPAAMRDPVPSQIDKVPEVNIPTSIDPKTAAIAIGAFALGVMATVVVVKNRHRIKAWWEDLALPRLVSGALRILDIDPEDLEAASAEVGPISTTEFSDEVAVVIEDIREDMTSEKAQKRMLLVLMAASIISENLRKLENARISDSSLQALQEAMVQLSTAEIVDRMNYALASGQPLLDDETRAIFVGVFRGGEFQDGIYRPLSAGAIERALRISDEDDDSDSGLAPA